MLATTSVYRLLWQLGIVRQARGSCTEERAQIILGLHLIVPKRAGMMSPAVCYSVCVFKMSRLGPNLNLANDNTFVPLAVCDNGIVCCGWPDIAGPCCSKGTAALSEQNGAFPNAVPTNEGWFWHVLAQSQDLVSSVVPIEASCFMGWVFSLHG